MAHAPALSSIPGFSPDSRVWVYVANRALTESEAAVAQDDLDAFVVQWTAHNQDLHAAAEVYDRQVLLLMVDETRTGASGCSIDKSVHFLETLGHKLNADFFERMRFGWVDDAGQLNWAGRETLASLVQEGRIGDATRMINTLARTRAELSEKWLLDWGKSWHRRVV